MCAAKSSIIASRTTWLAYAMATSSAAIARQMQTAMHWADAAQQHMLQVLSLMSIRSSHHMCLPTHGIAGLPAAANLLHAYMLLVPAGAAAARLTLQSQSSTGHI
jgi:hypothetical protein